MRHAETDFRKAQTHDASRIVLTTISHQNSKCMLISGSGTYAPHWTAPPGLTWAEESLLAGHNAMALLQWEPAHLHPSK